MHCWLESWINSYHIGTTDSIHLSPNIDFMKLYMEKKNMFANFVDVSPKVAQKGRADMLVLTSFCGFHYYQV